MANDEAALKEQVEKEKKLIRKMISEDKLKQALAKAKELAKGHIYTKKEFLDDAEEYGAETEELTKLLKPAWFVGSKAKIEPVKRKSKKKRKK